MIDASQGRKPHSPLHWFFLALLGTEGLAAKGPGVVQNIPTATRGRPTNAEARCQLPYATLGGPF